MSVYYCYDEFERMRLGRGAGITEKDVFEYDGLDRRDARLEGSAGTRRDMSYIGTSELLSRETKAGGEKRFYDYDSMGERQGQQVTDGAENHYRSYRKDANGSVLALEDDTGAVPAGERYEYDPYGELDAEPTDDEAKANPFRFEGFYYDSGVQSYDMHARAYRPEHGRFLNQDRYASATADLLMQADPLTQNRYAFGGGNPVNNVEFDGHVRNVPGGGAERGVVYEDKKRNRKVDPQSDANKNGYISYPESALTTPSAKTPSPRIRRAAWQEFEHTNATPIHRPIPPNVAAANSGDNEGGGGGFATIMAPTFAVWPQRGGAGPPRGFPGLSSSGKGSSSGGGAGSIWPRVPPGGPKQGGISKKVPPNPYGSRGGPAHQDRIEARILWLQMMGYRIIRGGRGRVEEFLRIPRGGFKTARRPDITAQAPNGTIVRENVGRSRKRDGEPVARERRALDDIERATGSRPNFIPYDRPWSHTATPKPPARSK